MWYDVDYKKLGILFLPISLRLPRIVAFVHCLLTPIETLYHLFLIYRKDSLYKMQYNGQVCYLRKVMNDYFDPNFRRILIVDGDEVSQRYIYTRGENKPVYLGSIFLVTRSDRVDGTGFIVKVPKGLAYDLQQMIALLIYYKTAGMRYKIKEYEYI